MSNRQRKPLKSEPKIVRPKMYVVGGGFDYIRLMYSFGFDGATGLDDADVVLFTGGEDVNPELYREIPLAKTHYNRLRDEKEVAIFEGARDRGLPMIGICRGGQFLNVMNGGRLWQHVSNHTNSHLAYIEVAPYNNVKGKDKRRVITVTSTHHQMMIPADEGMVLMTALEATDKQSVGYSRTGRPNSEDPDVEAVYYDATNSLCFQPHPEFANATADCVDFFEECIDNFIRPYINLKEEKKSKKKEKK